MGFFKVDRTPVARRIQDSFRRFHQHNDLELTMRELNESMRELGWSKKEIQEGEENFRKLLMCYSLDQSIKVAKSLEGCYLRPWVLRSIQVLVGLVFLGVGLWVILVEFQLMRFLDNL